MFLGDLPFDFVPLRDVEVFRREEGDGSNSDENAQAQSSAATTATTAAATSNGTFANEPEQLGNILFYRWETLFREQAHRVLFLFAKQTNSNHSNRRSTVQ